MGAMVHQRLHSGPTTHTSPLNQCFALSLRFLATNEKCRWLCHGKPATHYDVRLQTTPQQTPSLDRSTWHPNRTNGVGFASGHNLLPEEVVSADNVPFSQGQLQDILRDAASKDHRWAHLFSPRHFMHAHPLHGFECLVQRQLCQLRHSRV